MNQTTARSPFNWRKWLAIALGSMLVVLGFLWLALPAIIQSQAERFVREKTGHTLSMAKPEFNPLALRLRVAQLALATGSGEKLVGFDELLIDLSIASVGRAAMVFDEIRLDGLDLSFSDQADGSTNWAPLLNSLKSKEPDTQPAGPPPRLDIDRLVISRAALAFADLRDGRDFRTRIAPIEISLSNISTMANEQGLINFAARLESGAELSLDAQASLQPVNVKGKLSLTAFDLKTLAPYLKGNAPVSVDGQMTVTTNYLVSVAEGRADVSLDQISLTLDAVRLALVAQPGVSIDIVKLSASEGQFGLLANKASLDSLAVENLSFNAPGVKQAPGFAKLAVEKLSADLNERSAKIGKVSISGGTVHATRAANGELDLLTALTSIQSHLSTPTGKRETAPATATATDSIAAAPTEAAGKSAPAPAPWRYHIDEIALADWALGLRDESTKPLAELGLSKLSLAVQDVSEDLSKPLPLQLAAIVGTSGQLRVEGNLTPATSAANLKLSLTDFGLSIFQPYVAQKANMRLASGSVSTQGSFSLPEQTGKGAPALSYNGDFLLRDLRIEETDSKTPLLTWKRLRTAKMRATPTQLDIGELQLSGLDTQVIIYKDKTSNISRLIKAPAESAAAQTADASIAVPPAPTSGIAVPPAPTSGNATPVQAAAPAAAPAPTSANPFILNIARLKLDDGEMEFADHSLVLPFGTRIHELQGSINGISTRPGRQAQIELEGAVDEFGLARASGQLDMFNPTGFMDLAVSFRNVEMPRLSPYMATFAGRRIESGKLTLELQYKIKDRQMLGDNKLIIDRLTLGERVESPSAKDLPLNLAIALLEDSDGRIDLGLPVSGNLDDPQFSYGAIVWKAIVNVLTKIVTSPFRAIGALFGSDEQVEGISFEPGAGKLSPPEREKLVRVSSALTKRPTLNVGVRGIHTPADKVALQDQQLRRLLLVAMGDPVADDGDPGPVTTNHPKVRSELESLYAKRTSAADLAALKEGFRLANPGQLEESTAGKMMSRLGSLLREKKTLSDAEVSALKGADFHALLYTRVRALEPVTDDRLQALATTRGTYAFDLLKTLGVATTRLRLDPAQKGESNEAGIPLVLDLAPAK